MNADGSAEPDQSTRQSALILDRLALLSRVDDTSTAAGLLRELVGLMTIDSAAFLCVIRADRKRTIYRSLLACDPRWCAEFSQHNWHASNPWLRYAAEADELISSANLPLAAEDADFMRVAPLLGFRSALIAPARDAEAPSRVMVLALGSTQPHTFTNAFDARLQVLSRCLAGELKRCMLRYLRNEFLQQTNLTPAELDLLRLHHQGLATKKIAALLNSSVATVDGRFRRVLSKLRAIDRSSAARMVRLHGVL